MLEQELVKIGGTKLLGGTLLSIGGISALAVGGIIAWNMWNRDKNNSPAPQQPQTEQRADESAQVLRADLQAEIEALNAEKQKLSQQVDELKTQASHTIPEPLFEKKPADESFPKTNLKLGMLEQLIKENLSLRKATI
jgi:hypothetical protein